MEGVKQTKKPIFIVGGAEEVKSLANMAGVHGIDVCIKGESEDIIDIDGVKYTRDNPSKTKTSNLLIPIYRDLLSKVLDKTIGKLPDKEMATTEFIINEFKLIQNKKSKLTRSQRDRVEYTFHSIFKKLPDPQL